MSRGSRFTALVAAGLLAAAVFTAPAAAQATASISATAFVSGLSPLTAAGVNDLAFGNIPAGTPATPPVAGYGRYNISGQASTAVTVTYTLPTVLNGPGAATIPITFGATDGLQWATFPGAFTTYDPNAPHLTTLDASGGLIVGIRGTVSPPALAITGNYTGTVTMTVSY